MLRGSRQWIDPDTGDWGWSRKTARDVTQRVFDDMYGTGAKYPGISAGDAGQLSLALQQQGRMPIAGVGGGMGGEAAVKAQAEAISRTLKEWSGTVRALRDVFGDAGQPNAPLPQLLAQLDLLTSGATTQMGQGRLQQIVRTTANLANMSGIGLQGAMTIQQAAMPMVDAAGLNPVFANLAAQQAMAYSAAYSSQGLGASHGWGRLNQQQLLLSQMQGNISAQSSPLARRLGSLDAASQSGAFDPESNAGRALAAAKAGLTTFTDAQGNQVSINQSQDTFGQWVSQATHGAVSASEFRQMTGSKRISQYYLAQSPLMVSAVQREQGAEVQQRMQGVLRDSLVTRLTARGLTPQQAARIAARGARQLSQAFFSLDEAAAGDPNRRNEILGEVLDSAINEMRGSDDVLDTQAAGAYYADAGLQGSSRTQVRLAFADVSDVLGAPLAATHQQYNAKAVEGRRRALLRAEDGSHGMISRITQAIIDTKQGDPVALKKILGSAFGAKDKEQLQRIVQGHQQQLKAAVGRYKQVGMALAATEDPQEQQLLRTQLKSAAKEITVRVGALDADVDSAGLSRYSSVDKEAIAAFLVSADEDGQTGLSGEQYGSQLKIAGDVLAQYALDEKGAMQLGGNALQGMRQVQVASLSLRSRMSVLGSDSIGDMLASGDEEALQMYGDLVSGMRKMGKATHAGYMGTSVKDTLLLRKLSSKLGIRMSKLLSLDPDSAELAKLYAASGIEDDDPARQLRDRLHAQTTGFRENFADNYGGMQRQVLFSGRSTVLDLLGSVVGEGDEAKEALARSREMQELATAITKGGVRGERMQGDVIQLQAALSHPDQISPADRSAMLRDYHLDISHPTLPALRTAAKAILGQGKEGDGGTTEIRVKTDAIIINPSPDGGGTMQTRGTNVGDDSQDA